MAGERVKLLVVEDESIVALDLKSSLNMLGYEVVGTAASGADAIARAESSRPDLVLMDINLQGPMDGVEAANSIRARLHIPVIFLTACVDDATLQRAKVTEPFGYLIKPFEERELHGHIEIALYKHRMEKKLRESEERYSLAMQGANDGLWDWNLDTKDIYYSQRWKSMLGYEPAQIGNSPEEWFKRIHPIDKEAFQKKLAQHVAGMTGHFEHEYRILDSSGTYRWVLCRGLALRNGDGRAHRIAGSQTDITDRKLYNPLTGLPNRTLLVDRVERSLKRVKPQPQQEHPFALVALDVDDMKKINDSLGYATADRLLLQVARRIQGALSGHDTVAHCGNDVFVLLLENVRDAAQAALVAGRVQREIEQPFKLEGQDVYITACAGISLGNGDHSAEDLLRDASTAMNRAKAAGKGRCEIFDGNMRASAVKRLKLETDFRRAFDEEEFRLHYQPIVCLKTGTIAGFEALVRWQRPAGLVFPGEFLGLADTTDLIIPLERWVLHEACRQVAEWQAERNGAELLSANVNLSPKHYSSPELAGYVRKTLLESGLREGSLRLEITESALMECTADISETLTKLEQMNVGLHMDDFGTGYSSLSYLHRFPIQTLKIDRSFVGNLGLSEETWKIVQAIISLAGNLGMDVIAEGIENVMQLKMLQSLGCEYGQGYYFSKPVSPAGIEALLAHDLPWSLAFTSPMQCVPAAP